MKIHEGDLFTAPFTEYIVVILTDCIDGRLAGSIDHRFCFCGGQTQAGDYAPVFFCQRTSGISKRNGWRQYKRTSI